MSLKKSDDAVSPVIGVMLMLVITVIIAAVITGFATGMVKDTEPAPTAVLEVVIDSCFFAMDGYSYMSGEYVALYGPDLQIKHISGDPIDTGDIELRFSWTDANGDYHYSTYSADKFREIHPNGVGMTSSGYTMYRDQPMYMKSMDGVDGGYDNYFGSFILTSGSKVTASAEFLHIDWMGDGGKYINTGSPCMDVIFDNGQVTSEYGDGPKGEYTGGIMDDLQPGTAVNVMIIHLPSSKAIFDKVVFVE